MRHHLVAATGLSFALACAGLDSSPPPPIEQDATPLPSRLAPIALDGPRPDDCLVSIDDRQPMLAAVQPQATTPQVERGPNGLAETVWLSDGTEVRAVQRGCSDFGEDWEVTPAPGGSPLEAARAVMDRLAFERRPVGAHFALEAAPTDPTAGFPCGEAWCEIEVGADMLVIRYHLAL